MKLKFLAVGAGLLVSVALAGLSPDKVRATCNSVVGIDAQVCPGGGPRVAANIEIRAVSNYGTPNQNASALLAAGNTLTDGSLGLSYVWPGGTYTHLAIKYRAAGALAWSTYVAHVVGAGDPICGDTVQLESGGIPNQVCNEWVSDNTAHLRF